MLSQPQLEPGQADPRVRPHAAYTSLISTAVLVLIMITGSIVLWVGTPLGWLWVGSQIQDATSSLTAALGVAFAGTVMTVVTLARLLLGLSDLYRASRRMNGRADPGHRVLESVLTLSAAMAVTGFVLWFLFFAGITPMPLGIQL